MAKFNLIIPTHNRPNYLQRILDYYNSHGRCFNIIVADSSSDENKKLNEKIITSLPNLKIRHLNHYSPDINAHHKFADMVNYAEEKYCVFCADDDFITLNGIEQSIDFLEKNLDFTVADGNYISFYLKTERRGRKEFYWRPIPFSESITSPAVEERLRLHLSDYDSTLYAVHRTDFLKMIYKELLNSKVNPLLFGELLPSMITSIYGKMKHLDVLYRAQDSYSRYAYWPNLRDFKRKGKYEIEYEKFRNCLTSHLNKKSRLGVEEAKKVVDGAMTVYLRRSWSGGFKVFLTDRMKDIFDFLNLPYSKYEKARIVYSKLIDKSSSWKIIFPAKYHDDFDKIKGCVISHI